MGCGPSCVYYKNRGTTSACTNCRFFVDGTRPRFELGKVDIFKLAEGLQKREQQNNKQKEKIDNASVTARKDDAVIEICPLCGEKSAWRNPQNKILECMNIRCYLYKL